VGFFFFFFVTPFEQEPDTAGPFAIEWGRDLEERSITDYDAHGGAGCGAGAHTMVRSAPSIFCRDYQWPADEGMAMLSSGADGQVARADHKRPRTDGRKVSHRSSRHVRIRGRRTYQATEVRGVGRALRSFFRDPADQELGYGAIAFTNRPDFDGSFGRKVATKDIGGPCFKAWAGRVDEERKPKPPPQRRVFFVMMTHRGMGEDDAVQRVFDRRSVVPGLQSMKTTHGAKTVVRVAGSCDRRRK